MGEPNTETPGGETTDTGKQTTTTTPAPGNGTGEDKDWENSEGSGGKRAVLADLARERQQRQQLQQEADQLKAFKDGLVKLLGGGKDEEVDPAKLAERLTATEARADTAEKLLAVYRHAPAGADVQGLTDSVSFREGLAKTDDVKKYVTDFLKDNPRYAGVSNDAARRMQQGNRSGEPSAQNFDDILRGLAAR